MRIIYILLTAVGVAILTFFVGGALMNYTLREFMGDGAPQPSLWAWAVLWVSVLFIRNASTNIEIIRVRRWLAGDNEVPTEIQDLRDIRRELKETAKWTDRHMHEGDYYSGPPGERKDDLGEEVRQG